MAVSTWAEADFKLNELFPDPAQRGAVRAELARLVTASSFRLFNKEEEPEAGRLGCDLLDVISAHSFQQYSRVFLKCHACLLSLHHLMAGLI